jgi:hypothetical protein
MSHLGIRDDGPGQPPWCRGNATAVPATSKTAIAAGTVVLNRPPITRGTDSSNPSPSTSESGANLTSGAHPIAHRGRRDRESRRHPQKLRISLAVSPLPYDKIAVEVLKLTISRGCSCALRIGERHRLGFRGFAISRLAGFREILRSRIILRHLQ